MSMLYIYIVVSGAWGALPRSRSFSRMSRALATRRFYYQAEMPAALTKSLRGPDHAELTSTTQRNPLHFIRR